MFDVWCQFLYIFLTNLHLGDIYQQEKKSFWMTLNISFKTNVLNTMQYSNYIILPFQYKSWFYTLELSLARPIFVWPSVTVTVVKFFCFRRTDVSLWIITADQIIQPCVAWKYNIIVNVGCKEANIQVRFLFFSFELAMWGRLDRDNAIMKIDFFGFIHAAQHSPSDFVTSAGTCLWSNSDD